MNGQSRNILFVLAILVASTSAAAGANDAPLLLSVAPMLLAQKADGDPLSRESLFGDSLSEGADDLFKERPFAAKKKGSGLKGYMQGEFARAIDDPARWSKMRFRIDVSNQGALGDGIKYKLGVRLDTDVAYSLPSGQYPEEAQRKRWLDVSLRENYLDIGAGGWDFRLGRQHIVWGEMVGLYFADVVSARNLTEFILPEFEAQRIPQWAARAEYFFGDMHAELLWVPLPSYDEVGKPGADFFPLQPVPPGGFSVYRGELKPSRNISNTNYGLRFSGLAGGWDLSGFYYQSTDVAPTFSREIAGPTAFVFQAMHERIEQFGGTVSKDLGSVILKGEFVHTHGRQFSVLRVSDADGLVDSDTTDFAAGLDFSLPAESRLNLQVFQRIFADHDLDMLFEKRESGYSVFLTAKASDHIEMQMLWIASLDRQDSLLRPKVSWGFEKDLRAVFGADLFKGPQLGFFGQYNNRDRVYAELRYSF